MTNRFAEGDGKMTTDRNQHARARGPRIAAGLLGIAAFALAAAGCSMGAAGSAGYVAPTAPAASAPAAPATGQAITAQATALGVILVDGSGRTVYEFANDTNGTSACTGTCATNWPPVAAPSPLPTSLSGVTGQLGVITRQDGTSQLSVAGHPLYTFAGDTAPGQTNGQGKTLDGGLWTVASAAGAPVTAAAPAAPAAPTSAPVIPAY
jgi:predicted lipoprotein with Yx(FWY)xxD motif